MNQRQECEAQRCGRRGRGRGRGAAPGGRALHKRGVCAVELRVLTWRAVQRRGRGWRVARTERVEGAVGARRDKQARDAGLRDRAGQDAKVEGHAPHRGQRGRRWHVRRCAEVLDKRDAGCAPRAVWLGNPLCGGGGATLSTGCVASKTRPRASGARSARAAVPRPRWARRRG